MWKTYKTPSTFIKSCVRVWIHKLVHNRIHIHMTSCREKKNDAENENGSAFPSTHSTPIGVKLTFLCVVHALLLRQWICKIKEVFCWLKIKISIRLRHEYREAGSLASKRHFPPYAHIVIVFRWWTNVAVTRWLYIYIHTTRTKHNHLHKCGYNVQTMNGHFSRNHLPL